MAHCRHCNRYMIRHQRCRGSCRVPGTDHSHSDHPSAETQRDKTDTDCHRCTRLRRSHHKHSRHRSAASLQHMRHTAVLCSRYALCRGHYNSCNQWHPIQQMARILAHSPRTHDHQTSTVPRKHHSLCVACWVAGQPRIARTVSHQRCTRTSPSVTSTTRMQSRRHSVDCRHHIAHTHRPSRTRKHCPQQSMAGIQCDW